MNATQADGTRKVRSGERLRPLRLLRSNMFSRLIGSYLVVIILSLIVYFSMYSYAFDSMREYILTAGREAQTHAVNLLENHLGDCESMLVQLSNDPELLRFIHVEPPLTGSHYVSLRSMQNTLRKYRLTNSALTNVIIYYKNSGVLCSNRVASARTDSAYASGAGYLDMDFSGWRARMDKASRLEIWPAMRLSTPGNTQVVSYIRAFPSDRFGQLSAHAIIQLDVQTLAEALKAGSLSQSAASYVIDSAGTVLFGWQADPAMARISPEVYAPIDGYGEASVDGSRMAVFKTRFSSFDLTCVSVFDLDALMAETTQHKEMLIRILLLALVVELLFAFFISQRNYRPILDILHILPEKPKHGQSELSAIRASITSLSTESEEMRRALSRQQNTIRELCTGKLLGLEPGADSFDFKQSGIPESCLCHFVFVLHAHATDGHETPASPMRRANLCFVKQLEERRVADNILSFAYTFDRSAFILSLRDPDGLSDCIAVLADIVRALSAKSPANIAVGIGLPVDMPEQISRSFSEARLAAQQADLTGKCIALYDDVESRREVYDYSSDLESMLEQNIVAGNCEEALRIINEVYWKARESSASPKRLELLLNELYGTLLKVRQLNLLKSPAAERELYFMLNEIEFNANPYQRYTSIQQAVKYYCEQITTIRKAPAPSLCKRVSEYVEEQYEDTNLCLDSIAQKFNVSPKYLSRHFKEQSGANLSAFITHVRMKQASMFLREQDIDIAQLAQLCGYTSTNTFYKAFKRYWGVSPGSFRDEATSQA